MEKPKDWDKDERKHTAIEFGIIDVQSWNAAIEAAADMLDKVCGIAGDDIRKLKL